MQKIVESEIEVQGAMKSMVDQCTALIPNAIMGFFINSPIYQHTEETINKIINLLIANSKNIEEMKKKGLDVEEFELAKRTVYASNIKSFDSTEEIANNLIYNVFDGGDILDAPEIISSIDMDYVTELLNSMYKEEYYAMSVVNPLKKGKE